MPGPPDDGQFRLLDVPADAGPAAEPAGEVRVRRLSSKGIAPGDIVEVDKRGRRFHAVVVAIDQRESGRFDLEWRPLQRGVTHRTGTVRDVVAVWRRAV
ncbi:hypothetical protein NBH00_16445 [Paraconexibacter antarcticus]|uniref:Uncharacterized protein n=1 Tax=Paraconexibacter antarcticus TaxID=2949664 RepID=A0ABY5DQ58_9ACTN|nr:hypothetical protein [Paraconexibacter antarcticus]UTI62942.1 hypothetical protein NBH00_16445 [Paraconexibacter antarcticus]